jgi:hypothetical protein
LRLVHEFGRSLPPKKGGLFFKRGLLLQRRLVFKSSSCLSRLLLNVRNSGSSPLPVAVLDVLFFLEELLHHVFLLLPPLEVLPVPL